MRFEYLLESPHRGDSYKYTKRMIFRIYIEETIQKNPLFML